MANNTSTLEDAATPSDARLTLAMNIILYIFLVLCLSGNTLLVLAIVRVKQLKTVTNYFVVNLALCDMMNAAFIPFLLEITGNMHKDYPFGFIGCKLIIPSSTYAKNASIFTLVCVAVEGYVTIASIGGLGGKRRMIIAFLLIHILAIITVAPIQHYSILFKYHGKLICIENLSPDSSYTYTVCLFLLQYVIPLLIIVLMYSLAWFKLSKRNKRTIEMIEEYERKMSWSDSGSVTDLGNTNGKANDKLLNRTKSFLTQKSSDVEKKRSSKRIDSFRGDMILRAVTCMRRPTFISKPALMRYRQTKNTLKMFIAVVAVFAIFQLPNQVVWLNRNFYGNLLILKMSNILTYVSPVVNCWIYAGFNKRFRKAYAHVLRSIFSPGAFAKQNIVKAFSKVTTYYDRRQQQQHNDRRQQQQHKGRQIAFTNMFEYHEKNFDTLKHLYDFSEQSEEMQRPKSAVQKRKVKTSAENVFDSLKAPSQATAQSLCKNRCSSNEEIGFRSKHLSIAFKDGTIYIGGISSVNGFSRKSEIISNESAMGNSINAPLIRIKTLSMPALTMKNGSEGKKRGKSSTAPQGNFESLFMSNGISIHKSERKSLLSLSSAILNEERGKQVMENKTRDDLDNDSSSLKAKENVEKGEVKTEEKMLPMDLQPNVNRVHKIPSYVLERNGSFQNIISGGDDASKTNNTAKSLETNSINWPMNSTEQNLFEFDDTSNGVSDVNKQHFPGHSKKAEAKETFLEMKGKKRFKCILGKEKRVKSKVHKRNGGGSEKLGKYSRLKICNEQPSHSKYLCIISVANGNPVSMSDSDECVEPHSPTTFVRRTRLTEHVNFRMAEVNTRTTDV